MNPPRPHGNIDQSALSRKNDYLYRLSLKALIRNADGNILVIKEDGRTSWDLPGGGMDRHESIKQALARELKEEVNFEGDFEYRIIAVEEPALLRTANVLQVRLIFLVTPQAMEFSAGEDGDEVMFVSPETLQNSTNEIEQIVYHYSQLA